MEDMKTIFQGVIPVKLYNLTANPHRFDIGQHVNLPVQISIMDSVSVGEGLMSLSRACVNRLLERVPCDLPLPYDGPHYLTQSRVVGWGITGVVAVIEVAIRVTPIPLTPPPMDVPLQNVVKEGLTVSAEERARNILHVLYGGKPPSMFLLLLCT